MGKYKPGDREIVARSIDIWNDDKATETLSCEDLAKLLREKHDWDLPTQALEDTLRDYNLLPQSKSTYVEQTVSKEATHLELPDSVRVETRPDRGKGLYATKNIAKGELVFKELPLVFAIPVELIFLAHSGSACGYCGKPLRVADGRLMKGAGFKCNRCPVNWCTKRCKNRDLIHPELNHATAPFKMSKRAWSDFETFCLENHYRAAYLYGIMLLYSLKKDPKRPHTTELLGSLAKISQDVRQEAVTQANSLEFDMTEQLWKEGFEKLSKALRPGHDLTYERYLTGVGTAAINNIDGSIFAVHSHLNHSCQPNVEVQTVSRAGGIKVVSLEPIAEGEELCVTYIDPDQPVAVRQEKLRTNYGFICECPRCKAELKQPEPEASPETEERAVHFDKNPVSDTVEIETRASALTVE